MNVVYNALTAAQSINLIIKLKNAVLANAPGVTVRMLEVTLRAGSVVGEVNIEPQPDSSIGVDQVHALIKNNAAKLSATVGKVVASMPELPTSGSAVSIMLSPPQILTASPTLAPAANREQEADSSDGADNDSSSGVLIGTIIAAVCVCGLCSCAVWWRRARKNKSTKQLFVRESPITIGHVVASPAPDAPARLTSPADEDALSEVRSA